MKYGMTFVVDLYDFEEEGQRSVLTTPGDYIRMRSWCAENMPEQREGEPQDDMVDSLRRNYALVCHALKRRGELGDLGLPEELGIKAVDAMADRFSVYVNDVEDGQLPLKQGRGR